jgi:hypothetical protein
MQALTIALKQDKQSTIYFGADVLEQRLDAIAPV